MQQTHLSPRLSWLAVIAAGLILSGCGSDDSSSSNAAPGDTAGGDTSDGDQTDGGSPSTDAYQVARINAASYDSWAYFDLLQGKQVSEQDTWHLALQRTQIKLNGGVSGAGDVAGALLDEQAEFYLDGDASSSVFTNAVADTEAQALTASYDLSELQWSSDRYSTAMQDWYVYNPTTHQISAPQQSGWLVRHADGATYSKVAITDLSYGAISLSYHTQAAVTQQFAGEQQTLTATLEEGSSERCIDFDSAAAVDCSSADWEWRFEIDLAKRAINLWSNGGVHGDGNAAAFGPITAEQLSSYTSATQINGQDFSRHYSTDSSNSVFSEHSWYAYNLTGEHKLWPNFRTYAISLDKDDANAPVFALQVSNYYSLGDSGSPELRFRQINQGE
ncbi:hypothetical protein CHH28_06355 [Bacterioplanes sanyensis]|uniref:HmuY protein n=1 Tax=Bacterioplanes sanyensis TaxID=1249553 RepID=A0A222FIK5_9GAMM|nr:HmuY family protein [Bacterioplanes sanyensis]ASP38324.1 hypothetical protein CHH28_06355 [Bacterioplanes sanyensis]